MLVAFFFCTDAKAAIIKGRVKDNNGKGVAGGNVVLLKEDSKTLVMAELTA